MNAVIERIRLRLSVVTSATVRFYRTNTPVLLSAVTVFSVLLIVWARLGFTFEIGRFFAAEPPAGSVEIYFPAPGGGMYVFDSQKSGCFGAVACPNQQASQCGGILGGGGSGSIAYDVRVGHAKYDVTNNVLFSEDPVYVNDWTRWKWIQVPTSEEIWCDRSQSESQEWVSNNPASPPAAGPGRTVRCIDGTAGFVPLNCAKVIGGSATTPTATPATSVAPTATPDITAPAAGTIVGFCSGGSTPRVTLRWAKTLPPGSPPSDGSLGMNRFVEGVTTQLAELLPIDRGQYWEYADANIQANKDYSYWAKYRADVRTTNSYNILTSLSNCGGIVATTTVAPTVTPTATPPQTPVTTPTPPSGCYYQQVQCVRAPCDPVLVCPSASATPSSALSCAPVSQTVAVGQEARVDAAGGDGDYEWQVLENRRDITPDRRGDSAYVTFSSTGTFSIEVLSGNQSATCQVVVVQQAQPTPVATVLVSLVGRNATTNGALSDSVQLVAGQQLELQMLIRNTSSTSQIGDVRASLVLPAGLQFIAGSMAVNGTSSAGVPGGFVLGVLAPNQEVRVTLRAIALASQFPIGSTQIQAVGQVQATNVPTATDGVSITVVRQVASSVGTVQTGPGEALLAALLVSAIMTLLYVSYTHTSTYRRREVTDITRQRDPLDFRS